MVISSRFKGNQNGMFYMRYCISVLVVLFSFSLQASIRIGAVGDSMTDEYLDAGTQANTDVAAYNWVEILAKLRADDLDWGEYKATVKHGWPDHRAAGYQYNYAKVAATANNQARMVLDFWFFKYEMLIDSSAVGSRYVADQVPMLVLDNVDIAIVAAGSNDYFYKTTDFSVFGEMRPNGIVPDMAFNRAIAEALLQHVDELINAGSKVLLASIPEGTAAGIDDQVVAAIREANTLLKQGAEERGIPMVNFFGFDKNADGGVSIGDFTVIYGSAAKAADLLPQGVPVAGKCRTDKLCAGPTHKNHFIADDGLHPNTLIQALMANQVIKALNLAYSLNISVLSDAEILSLTTSN